MSNAEPVRRVVTGHDDRGRATIRSDDLFRPERIAGGDADFALIWTAASLPADNNEPIDGRQRSAGLTIHQGSVIRVVDIHPGFASPMHRTNSLDYGVVLSGEVELELDDGVRTLVRPGDIVVQRGTMHLWRNPSEAVVCRIVFVLTEATPYEHEGRPLEEVQP